MIKTGDKEVDYLLVLLDCALKQTKAPKADNIDMQKLLNLSISQQVYNIILPSLEEIGALSDEEHSKWNDYRFSELKKTLFVNNAREQICQEMDKQNIKYIFLKGLILREFYPKSFMRQMSDNDILFDASRRDDLAKIMKAQGFELKCATEKSDDYYKEPACTIEFHRELFNHIYMQKVYNAEMVWNRAIKADGDNQQYMLSPEDNYIFTISHMYKHYIMEGLGIRFLCDLYLLKNHYDNLDYDYINKTIKIISDNIDFDDIKTLNERIDVNDFEAMALGLCDCIFSDKTPNKSEMGLLHFMMNGAVYGKANLQLAMEENGGKLGLLLHRLFPPYSIMKNTYLKLEKMPFLLPYYHIKRIINGLINEKSKIKKEFNAIKNYELSEDR